MVVDDEPDIRGLVHLVLDLSDDDIAVVAEAATAAEGLARWREERPEVIVLDDHMPGGRGIDLAEAILAECRSQRVILFSASLDDTTVERADRIGVRCLSKERLAELPDIIREAAD